VTVITVKTWIWRCSGTFVACCCAELVSDLSMSSQDPAADQLLNPFKSRTSVPTYPQCIWDILKDHPDGMTIADILQQLQGEGRRDLSGLKKPNGQVCVLVA
jgi:hypothetical protein